MLDVEWCRAMLNTVSGSDHVLWTDQGSTADRILFRPREGEGVVSVIDLEERCVDIFTIDNMSRLYYSN